MKIYKNLKKKDSCIFICIAMKFLDIQFKPTKANTKYLLMISCSL